MKMTIARALKEKNRIVGKINTVRATVMRENAKSGVFATDSDISEADMVKAVDSKRRTDVKALEAEWKALEERLVAVKTAIQKANVGAIETLVRLQEAKSHLAQLDSWRGGEPGCAIIGNGSTCCTTVALDPDYEAIEKEKYTDLVNKLQDEIDEYNAVTTAEIAD